MAARYRLKLNRLDFVSPVDVPAQETARVLLIKRAGPAEGFARVAKVDDELGLVFCWAFTSTLPDGSAYHDLQGDCIDEGSFVKAAAEFMAGARAVDDMHDGQQSGIVAFAMPMTPEIANAFGVVTKTIGLMVALKPSKAALAKFKSGEYTGVSIAGLGERETLKARAAPRRRPGTSTAPVPTAESEPYRRVGKMAVLTSETAGHAHSVDLDAPAGCWSDSLSTSYQTAEGATEGHCHAWIYDPSTGAITIAPDSGHTHTLADVVPVDVLAAVAGHYAAADDKPPCAVADPPSGGTTIVIAARAPAGNSTPTGGAPTVESKEPRMPTAADDTAQIASLRKLLAAAIGMTETQRLHVAKLAPADAEAFLALSATERNAILEPLEVAKREAQEVVFVSRTGELFRKLDDPRMVALAKRADAAERVAEQQIFEKRAATELSHFAKVVGVRAAIVQAIDGIADEAVRKDAHEALRGANFALAKLGTPTGTADGGAGPEAADPLQAFEAGRAEFAKAHQIDNPIDATGAFLGTPAGRALKAAYDQTRGYASGAVPS